MDQSIPVSPDQATAFRLSQHHLSEKAPYSKLYSVAGDMGGAQAQVLSAAKLSMWTRLKDVGIKNLDSAIWKDHSLVRAWAMRRTMFLLPSNELAVFVRGTNRRAMYPYKYALSKIGSQEELDKLLDTVLGILQEPSSRTEVAEQLNKSYGYKIISKLGGGWGNKNKVSWVKVGKSSLPVGFLFHVIGAKHVIVSGPNKGNESTFVSADKWIRNWKDVPIDQAEKQLLIKYLHAFAPATLQDFALWAGMYVRDAKEIWSKETEHMVQVDVDGLKSSILQSDLPKLSETDTDEPIVRLLPNFDSYLLGHRSHRNIVDPKNQQTIYRSQGWVSPVLLVNGRAIGVWSQNVKNGKFELQVTTFSKLPSQFSLLLKEEAQELARFLGYSDDVKIVLSRT